MTYITLTESAAAGSQNLIDNSSFDIWQRGTSFSGVASNTYTADRWKVNKNVGGTTTVAVAQESTTVDQGQYSAKLTMTTAQAGGSAVLRQILEPSLSLALVGKQVTVTVRINTNTSGVIAVSIDGNITATAASSVVTTTNSWVTVSVTSNVIASGDTAIGLNIGALGTAANSVTYIDSVMMTIGTQPVNFVPTNPEWDLARCERYYFSLVNSIQGGNLPGSLGNGYYDGTNTDLRVVAFMPVTMRVAPTITVGNLGVTSQGGTNTGWVATFNGPTDRCVSLMAQHSGNVTLLNGYNWSMDFTASADL